MFVIIESSSFFVSFFSRLLFNFFCFIPCFMWYFNLQLFSSVDLERRVYVDGCSENLGNETSDEPSCSVQSGMVSNVDGCSENLGNETSDEQVVQFSLEWLVYIDGCS
jgi:hypothetical protein